MHDAIVSGPVAKLGGVAEDRDMKNDKQGGILRAGPATQWDELSHVHSAPCAVQTAMAAPLPRPWEPL